MKTREETLQEEIEELKKKIEWYKWHHDKFRNGLIEDAKLFEKLDEAMATPERIEEDTRYVGGFVSGIDMVYTAEDVIDRAIKIIKGKIE
jgi:hypothetical protein